MTHGRGKKAGRGAGLRGGKGNAGLLKHRYMYMTKNMPDHFGRHGFKRPQSIIRKDRIINVGELEERYPNKKVINLSDEGIDKLLGGGKISTKIKVTVESASGKAIEKIKEHGGEVILAEPDFVEQKEEVEEETIDAEEKNNEKTASDKNKE